MNPWILGGLGFNLAMVFMAVTWAICRRLNNASFVDVAWVYSFTLIVGFFSLVGPGDPFRKALITAMVTLWSLRLGTHLLIRAIRLHPRENPRYRGLREQFPQRTWFMFFGFFELQAVLIALLSIPFAIISSNPTPGLSPWEILGALIWLVGFVGETLADFQLHRFRSAPENKGAVCANGLWRYSRHPNYFFEWIVWIGYFVFALGSPWGWITFFCPVLILHFLLNVTGIPPAEEQSLASRGDAYRDYQHGTSPFIPMPPKWKKGAMVRVPGERKP